CFVFSLLDCCEAEIYAGAMAAQELRSLTYLLTDLGEQPRSPPVLYVDNKAMIALCQEHSLEHRTKHIALQYFLARELQQRGQLRLAYVATRANTAHIFTKALLRGDHQCFSTVLGLPRSRLPLAVLTLLALLSLLASSVAAADVSAADAQAGTLAVQTATATATNSSVAGVDLSRVVLLSPWAPRAFLYKQFLSDAECDHIIARATPRLERSGVVNNDDGSSFVSEIRTSSGAFLNKGEDAVMRTVEQRISEWTFLPLQNQEALQVSRPCDELRHVPEQGRERCDANSGAAHLRLDLPAPGEPGGAAVVVGVSVQQGHRYATVLMYLNNVTLGGETVFPKVKDDSPKDESWSDCAKGFLADPASLHYACPVLHGVKWSAPKWIHVADFDKPLTAADPGTDANGAAAGGGDGACTDSNAYCQYWAEAGECEKNPVYMHEACRKACKVCS
ncbi:unnamed protein product, partial [Closterium sp. NIES-53]